MHPTYRAQATVIMDGGFAVRLERSIERSGVVRNGGPLIVDHSPPRSVPIEDFEGPSALLQ